MDEELSDIIDLGEVGDNTSTEFDLFNCGGTQKPATLKQAFGEARTSSNCITPRDKIACFNPCDRKFSEQAQIKEEITVEVSYPIELNSKECYSNLGTKNTQRKQNNDVIHIECTDFDEENFECVQNENNNQLNQILPEVKEKEQIEKENTSAQSTKNNKDLEHELNSSSPVPLVEIRQNTAPVVITEEKKKPAEEIEKRELMSAIDDSYINKEVSKHIEKKYLVFRPYIDPLTVKPYIPSDRGYYFKILNCDIKIVRYTLEDNGFREAKANILDWTVMWYCGSIKTQIYQGLTKYQKVNHFPRSNELTRKDLICENMNRMNSLHGDAHYDFVPKTYNLPKEHTMLVEEMERDPERWWIVKPAASSQGKGIYFTNNINELPYKQNSVVSHYINNPMLINGYKYDLRIYIAVTSINPLRLYMYEEGLVRFATAKYKPLGKESFTKYTHLTNYSVNKKNANFIQNNDASQDNYGSKWSLTAFWKYCKNNGIDDLKIRRRIEDVVIKSVISAEHVMSKAFDMFVPYHK